MSDDPVNDDQDAIDYLIDLRHGLAAERESMRSLLDTLEERGLIQTVVGGQDECR